MADIALNLNPSALNEMTSPAESTLSSIPIAETFYGLRGHGVLRVTDANLVTEFRYHWLQFFVTSSRNETAEIPIGDIAGVRLKNFGIFGVSLHLTFHSMENLPSTPLWHRGASTKFGIPFKHRGVAPKFVQRLEEVAPNLVG
ncbi:MAG: hypothetical protein AAGA96_17175 [Verrucomicrobiota bacterium]